MFYAILLYNKGNNMYKRLKHGEFIAMTPEQKQEHLRVLRKRYREAHPDKIHRDNLHYYQVYKKTKPHQCICVKCGKSFYAPRWYFKWCDDCKNKNWSAEARNMILAKRQERKERRDLVLKLAKKGLLQKDIAEQTGYSQRAVSAIMIRNGIRREPKHIRTTNV